MSLDGQRTALGGSDSSKMESLEMESDEGNSRSKSAGEELDVQQDNLNRLSRPQNMHAQNTHAQFILAGFIDHFVSQQCSGLPAEIKGQVYERFVNNLGIFGVNLGQAVTSRMETNRAQYINGSHQYLDLIIKDVLQPDAPNGISLENALIQSRPGSSGGNQHTGLAQFGLQLANPSPFDGGPSALEIQGQNPAATFTLMSRSDSDFKDMVPIGKGGFGSVFKVVHKLDGITYALKKIKIKSRVMQSSDEHGMDKVLEEIRTLARLEHPHIVRYFGSWIDSGTISFNSAITGSPKGLDTIKEEADEPPGFIDDHSGPEIEFAADSDETCRIKTMSEGTADQPPADQSSSPGASSGSEWSSSVFGSARGTIKTSMISSQSGGSPGIVTLNILMSLHPFTLLDFLSFNPKSQSGGKPSQRHCYCFVTSLRLFQGILVGVEYLHSEDVVHRDLKPGNVFLNLGSQIDCCEKSGTAVIPKIGDFGLATKIDRNALAFGSTSNCTAMDHNFMSSHAGTAFYSPPEGGKTSAVDVWALGVILLELLYKFETVSERSIVLSKFTTGHVREDRFPPDLLQGCHPRILAIMEGCCEQDLRLRLTIPQIKTAVKDVITEIGKKARVILQSSEADVLNNDETALDLLESGIANVSLDEP